jgi:hypothetical protein
MGFWFGWAIFWLIFWLGTWVFTHREGGQETRDLCILGTVVSVAFLLALVGGGYLARFFNF